MITVQPQSQPPGIGSARRAAREQPHRDRPLDDVANEAIQAELWRRQTRRVCTTDAAGAFVVEGLADASHTVLAYHPRYDVQPLQRESRVHPDAVVDFVAHSVAAVPVVVNMPDGALAEQAWLRWESADGARRGNLEWTRDADVVRLPTGTVKVKATAWEPAPLESLEVTHEVRAGDGPGGDRGDPLVLTLETRRVLTARLVLPEGFVAPRRLEYRVRLAGSARVAVGGKGDGVIDPAAMISDRTRNRASTPTPGRASWFDLEPGRYVVAAFLERRLLGHAIATVADTAVEVDLPVELPRRTLEVRLVERGGAIVPGDASFRVLTGDPERPKITRVDAMRQTSGAWTVFLDGIDDKNDPKAMLRVGTRYGGAIRDIDLRGGGALTIKLDQPALLSVQLDRYAGSGVEGALFVALRSEYGADGWGRVGADGTCEMSGVQPGDYRFELMVRKNNQTWSLYSRPVRLRSGAEEEAITVPQLHTLQVRWAGGGRPRDVQLRCNDESVGSFRRTARLNGGKKASFDLLAPGSYELRCGRTRTTVRVPSAEVVLQ